MDKDTSQTLQSKRIVIDLDEIPEDVTERGAPHVSQIPSTGLINLTAENARKRKKTILKDENAPKAPLTGYLRFMGEHRDTIRVEKPNMAFHDLTKVLGTMWTELPQEQKQYYLDIAEKDKAKYVEELAKYQKTDAYKSFLAQQEAAKQEEAKKAKVAEKPSPESNSLFCRPCNKQFFSHHNKNEHIAGRKHRMMVKKITSRGNQYRSEIKAPEPRVITVSQPVKTQPLPKPVEKTTTDTSTVENSLDIPVFSQQFLDYNRSRESELRKLKRATNECEEQNAILTKQNDSLKSAISKLEEEGKRSEKDTKQLDPFLKDFRTTLARSFADVRLPGSDEGPNEGSVDDFLGQLCRVSTQGTAESNETLMKIKQVISQLDYPKLKFLPSASTTTPECSDP